MMRLTSLTHVQKNVLQEIGNKAAGNAAISPGSFMLLPDPEYLQNIFKALGIND